jgi:hypothetical protein
VILHTIKPVVLHNYVDIAIIMAEPPTNPSHGENAQQEPDAPQHPSWKSLVDSMSSAALSLAFYHLHWSLFGPISDNIIVMKDATDHASPTEPFVASLPNGGISLHSIANEPLTEPPISCITVYAEDLMHLDYDAAPELLVLRAEGQPYVTIGEYVTKVYPWINAVQDAIIAALEELYGPLPDGIPRGPQHRIWVWINNPAYVSLQEEEIASEWPEKWRVRDYDVAKIIEGRRGVASTQVAAQGGNQAAS